MWRPEKEETVRPMEHREELSTTTLPRNHEGATVFGQKMIRKAREPFILLVEDNPGDVQLMVQAFKESGFDYHLRVAKNGIECLNYLRKKGNYANSQTPDLIILDLNLPKKDGRSVLAELKQDAILKRIPVIILSMSQAEEDILMSYELNANCFINKPVDLDQFIGVVKTIKEFWINTVKLPPDWGATH